MGGRIPAVVPVPTNSRIRGYKVTFHLLFYIKTRFREFVCDPFDGSIQSPHRTKGYHTLFLFRSGRTAISDFPFYKKRPWKGSVEMLRKNKS
jgi:hypothetical protein